MNTKFKKHNFYMHKDALDSCIEVIRVLEDRGDGEQAFFARWWSLGYVGRPYMLTSEEYMFMLNQSEANAWIELDYESLNEPRSRSGIPEKYRSS